jgi:hypothetical protein
MAKSIIPPSINILDIITKKAGELDVYFSPRSPEFIQLKKWLKHNQTPDNKEIESDCITYFQLLLLTTLSMHQGIFIPSIRQITDKGKTCEVMWSSGVIDKINYGKFDDQLEKFIQSLKQKVLTQDKNETTTIFSLVSDTQKCLDSYNLLLTKVQKQIDKVLNGRNHFEQLFNDNLSRELVFVLLSCLPPDQMNALFLYLHKFFPEELTCKLPDGMTVKVVPFLQKTSNDLHYLVQKVIIYFELYTDTKKPIIKHITQSKTKEFMVDLMKNPNIKENAMQNLISIKEKQIGTRKHLYKLLKDHLKEIYK